MRKDELIQRLNKTYKMERSHAFFTFPAIAIYLLFTNSPLDIVFFLFDNWTIKTENMIYWAIIANVFGILEHINYYNRQLMIDNSSDLNYVVKNRKLKIASLAKDLIENRL